MGKRGVAVVVGAGVLALGAWLLWSRGQRGASGVNGSGVPRGGAGTGGATSGRRADRAGAPAALGSIEGTVRDLAGAPIGGAHVCGNASSVELATDDIREPICVSTGADGRYRLADLLPAAYRIDASAPSLPPGPASGPSARTRRASARTRRDAARGRPRPPAGRHRGGRPGEGHRGRADRGGVGAG